MIKAIIFDLGGVIVNVDKVIQTWSSVFKPKNKKDFWKQINFETAPLCRCEITEKQFWENVCKRFKIDKKSVPNDLLVKNFRESIKINKELTQLIFKLRKKYKLGVISNIIEAHSKINKIMGLYRNFNCVVLSFEVKMTKDSKEIFLIAAKKLGVRPQECLFIDDIDRYASVASSVGMKAIVYKNNKQLKNQLSKFIGD